MIYLIVKFREDTNSREWQLESSYRFKIWQVHLHKYCQYVLEISQWSGNFEHKSRGFEAFRDLTIRRDIEMSLLYPSELVFVSRHAGLIPEYGYGIFGLQW